MTTVLHHDTPEVPAQDTPARGPRVEVERVDALDCTDTAFWRIGTHLTCNYHRLEVASALWGADARLPMFEVDPTAGYVCGERFPEVVA